MHLLTNAIKMSVVTWLLSRVFEADDLVSTNSLYATFELEAKEARIQPNISQREFSEYVLNVFPNTERSTKRLNSSQTVKAFKGIALRSIGPFPQPVSSDLKEIITFLPDKFNVIKTDAKCIICSVDSMYKINGNLVRKVLTFFDSLKWSMTVGDTDIDIVSLKVDDGFIIEENSIKTICKIVEKIEVCHGMEINNSVICSRFHTVETLYNCESNQQTRRIRSLMCNKILRINARTKTCKTCQKMTFTTKTEQKENLKSSYNRDMQTVENIPVSKETFKKLLPFASDEMLELLANQAQNGGRDPRGRRWSQTIIQTCLQVYSRSPAGYKHLKQSNLLLLPSPKVLILYKNRVKHKPGFQEDIFRWMYNEAERLCIPENGRVGGIILDEMSIQQDIQINKTGEVVEIVGFEDIGSEGNACNTLRKGKQEKELGTHVLQFVFLGITGFRFPFAHFVTTNIQAYDIYSLFWEAVDYLYMFGFTAIYACTDGAQSNRSFIYINLGKDPLTTISTSPCNPNKSVIFMMDISHVIKKIRNNVLKSGVAKFSTRNLTLPDKSILQWEMWVNAYKWDQQNALQLHRKLTNEHIFLTQQGKMRNHLAEEVLNSEMLNLMLEYKASLANQGDILNGVLEFLKKNI